MKIRKPTTISDTTRISHSPELVISCIGYDKKLKKVGYVIINLRLKEELLIYEYLSMGICEENEKIYLLLSSNAAYESSVYKLTDVGTTVTNQMLFREISDLCKLDFSKYDTYHFPSIEYSTDKYGNPFAIVNMSKYYVTGGKHIPYEDELSDDWSDLYNGKDLK